MDDWTDGDSVSIRRLGLLTELSDRQGEVQGLINDNREMEDKSLENGLIGNLGYDDDLVIAMVLAVKENSKDPESEVTNFDVIWAGGLLDHLDTLGFEVKRKKRKK